MNKINPLYVLGFFVLVLIVMIVQNRSMQNKITEATQQVSVIKRVGQEIAFLKQHWKNPKQAKKNIDALLNNRMLQNRRKNLIVTRLH